MPFPLIDMQGDLNHVYNPLLLTDGVMIDAGANVGSFIEMMREDDIQLPIYAIECASDSLNIIKKKIAGYPHLFSDVTLLEKALVGSPNEQITLTEFLGVLRTDGTKKYHQWANILGIHEARFTFDPDVQIMKSTVDGITIGELIRTYDLKSIDYLKMDIEGAEYSVFEHLSQEDASLIKQMSLETHISEKNEELRRRLNQLGFHTFDVIPNDRGGELYACRKEYWV